VTPQQTERARNAVTMARAVLAAVEASERALEAVNAALATGATLGVATFGFGQLMAVRSPLSALVHPDGAAVVLARNEIRAMRALEHGRG